MLAWQLAQRFRQGKQASRYLSFISFSSTVGIGLGCFVLIVLLSVMNGFERELKDRLLGMIPHAELFNSSEIGFQDWQHYSMSLREDPRVVNVEPYTKLTGLISHKGQFKPTEITGLDLQYNPNAGWHERVDAKALALFEQTPDGVLLGVKLARELGLSPGDKINFMVPTLTYDLSFKAPKNVPLTLVGTINLGGELDSVVGIMHLDVASQAAQVKSGAQGLRFTLVDPFIAYQYIREIGYPFPQDLKMSSWVRTQGHLYQDIQLVRVVINIALVLVIAVACFNIVSTLVMGVREKRSAIAILRTMGASDQLIRGTFVFQGMINALIGIVVGTGAALLIAPNLSDIIRGMESLLGFTLLSGDIYFIDFMPSELHWDDVLLTVSIAALLSVVATLYPANKAVKLNPASGLNR